MPTSKAVKNRIHRLLKTWGLMVDCYEKSHPNLDLESVKRSLEKLSLEVNEREVKAYELPYLVERR